MCQKYRTNKFPFQKEGEDPKPSSAPVPAPAPLRPKTKEKFKSLGSLQMEAELPEPPM